MNKIIIVGHPQSGYAEVERLLIECGMATALPSRRENLSPIQIGQTLLKAHEATPIEQLSGIGQLAQIDVAPIWQGMMLDLMLANLEQPLWGWADPQAIYFLDYLKEQDPKALFVLVYDEPQNALTRLALDQAAITSEECKRRIDAWVRYNATILDFFQRNPKRTLLVHTRQIRKAPNHFIEHLNTKINTQLKEHPVTNHSFSALKIAATSNDLTLDNNLLAHFLASSIIAHHQPALKLYADLQSTATQALRSNGYINTSLALCDTAKHLHNAWQALVNIQTALQSVKQDANNVLILQEENQSLLTALHQTQEEFERYYYSNNHKQTAHEPKPNHYGAADRIKQHLSYRLGAVMLEKSRTIWGWICMPWALIDEIKQFKKELPARQSLKLPPIESYKDSHEAERTKQHLSYRLGSTMLKHSKTLRGWLSMPWALRKENQAFQAQQKKIKYKSL